MKASMAHAAPAAQLIDGVPGTDRLLGRSQAELTDAMTWLAWYAAGTYTAVMDYMDTVNGEPIPGRPARL